MKKLIIPILTIALILESGFLVYQNIDRTKTSSTSTISSTCSKISTTEVIRLSNVERVKAGLPELVENQSLDQAATAKAQDMVNIHYWAHNSPTGITPWYWIKQAGYPYTYAGENLAENFSTANGVVIGWMNSEGHRANVLNTHYEEVGVAATCGVTDHDTTVVVAEYGNR